jgi:hypothetical protein
MLCVEKKKLARKVAAMHEVARSAGLPEKIKKLGWWADQKASELRSEKDRDDLLSSSGLETAENQSGRPTRAS